MNTEPELHREIATTNDLVDITRGYTGALALSGDHVLRLRGAADLRIYSELKTDDQVKPVMEVRQQSLLSKEFIVEPGGKRAIDVRAADSMRAQIARLPWNNITKKMLWGVYYGYAVAEVIYERRGAEIAMQAIKVRNRARFRFTPEGQLRMLTRTNMNEGVPCEQPYFWSFATGADHDDEPYGLGLAHYFYWPVYMKRHGVRSWIAFLDKYGAPTTVGRYEINATDAEQQKLLAATQLIKSSSGVILPKGMDLTYLESARSGTADYAQLVTLMNNAIAKIALGQVGTTEATSGKFKLEAQAEVAEDIVEADDDLLSESFKRAIAAPLTQWNYPGAETPVIYRAVRSQEDLNTQAERIVKISGIGFKPSLNYIKDMFGGEWEEKPGGVAPGAQDASVNAPSQTPANFAEPQETLRKAMQGGGGATEVPEKFLQPIATGFPSIATLSSGVSEPKNTPDYADALVLALSARASVPIEALLADVVAAVQKPGQDYAGLLQTLAQFADLDVAELGQAMAEASALAGLAGRAEVIEETGA